jgi:regulator of replication initiation timing
MATTTGAERDGISSSSLPTIPSREDDGSDIKIQDQVIISKDIRALESSINTKFAELQNLLQQHDRSVKQMLKAHQNSVKQSVKAQLEKAQADQRKHLEDALQKQAEMFHMCTERLSERRNEERE